MAFGYKREIPRAWGWVLFSGLVDVLLAFIILSGFPGTATWVIGLMVGINLVMMGVALIVAAYHCSAAPTGSAFELRLRAIMLAGVHSAANPAWDRVGVGEVIDRRRVRLERHCRALA